MFSVFVFEPKVYFERVRERLLSICYSENMKVSLNAVLGSYEYQDFRAGHYFVLVVQVFSKLRHIFYFHRVRHIMSLSAHLSTRHRI